MPKTNPRKKTDHRISFRPASRTDLFEALCSHSQSKEACQAYVERLEEASLNIAVAGET